MNWRENLKKFFLSGENEPVSRSGVSVENGAPLLLRVLLCSAGKPVVAALPDAPLADQILHETEVLAEAAGITPRILFVPECGRGKLLFPGGEARRARAINRILNEPFDLISGSVHALLGAAPPPEESAQAQLELRPGLKISLEEVVRRLVQLDYDDEVTVTISGEFAKRGGILDIYSPAHDDPCRVEFFGDRIDSMRFFAADTQRSTGKCEAYRIINRAGITAGGPAESDVFAYVEKAGDFRLLEFWPEEGEAILRHYSVPGAPERLAAIRQEHETLTFCDIPAAGLPQEALPAEVLPLFPGDFLLSLPEGAEEKGQEMKREFLRRRMEEFHQKYPAGKIVMLSREKEDLPEIRRWCMDSLPVKKEDEFDSAPLSRGFLLTRFPMLLLCEEELTAAGFRRGRNSSGEKVTESGTEEIPPQEEERELPDFSLTDFDEGDMVVHLDYGIGIYRGIRRHTSGGTTKEVMVLEYRDAQLLYLPCMQAHKVSRYLGSPGKVKLHALTGGRWNAEKESVRQGVRYYAADMLRFQAVRQAVPGISFSCDAVDFRAFLRAFPFKDTDSQRRATSEISADMLRPKPMDRLLCGDVGYGKTEIAIRAAFRAVSAGYQVAVIAPTTVLAQQHFRSFTERFREYPFTIACVTRFSSAGEQGVFREKLQSGGIDILIGTHRLCGSTFPFKNLGLVIIDEEQRFGVDQKERLRRFRVEADVLSMSATPIPRTLYLAMAGARDLSTLLSPPKMRLPVKTVIAPQEEDLIASAVKAELARGGQVYYLHNRVATIEACADGLRQIVPGCRIAVAHGQMSEEQLSGAMSAFLEGKADMLVCSTIIESGLDIPNANTIIIERADRFGLAELYQLRGRVGRWKQQAYAYMLLPKNQLVGTAARKRLAAIRRCSSLGAGFQLALRDLEIRGSGNLLGSEQSGHLNKIGFDLYCRLLKQEISKLKGIPEETLEEPEISLDFLQTVLKAPAGVLAACFPETYLENERLRLSAYRRIAEILRLDQLEEFAAELRDRFGALPEETQNLFALARIRILCTRAGFRSLVCAHGIVTLSNPGGVVYRENGRCPRLDPRDSPQLRLLHLEMILRRLPVKLAEKKEVSHGKH